LKDVYEPTKGTAWLLLLILSLGCHSATPPPPAATGRAADAYAVRDLGPGGCLAMSDEGLIAGFVEAQGDGGSPSVDGAGQTGAFLLSPDRQGNFARTFLGKRAATDTFSVVTQVRGARLAGFTQGPDHSEAVLYDRGTSAWATLGALGGGDLTQATGITAGGWVVGLDRAFPELAAPINHAVLYSPGGEIVDVGLAVTSALGGQRSVGLAINEAGVVVGAGETGDAVQRGYTYDRTTHVVTPLGTLGGAGSQAMAIDTAGDIAGLSDTPEGNPHAFVRWAGTQTLDDLGTLGGPKSWPRSINDGGLVLGLSDTPSGDVHPFVASKSAAGWKVHDLFLDQTGLYSVMTAVAINGKGDIVGDGLTVPQGERRCTLWSPK
jgi:probable HAF family extracellular repeat protein